jgi:hypothetical protein
MNLVWPRPCLFRPPLRLFLVILHRRRETGRVTICCHFAFPHTTTPDLELVPATLQLLSSPLTASSHTSLHPHVACYSLHSGDTARCVLLVAALLSSVKDSSSHQSPQSVRCALCTLGQLRPPVPLRSSCRTRAELCRTQGMPRTPVRNSTNHQPPEPEAKPL